MKYRLKRSERETATKNRRIITPETSKLVAQRRANKPVAYLLSDRSKTAALKNNTTMEPNTISAMGILDPFLWVNHTRKIMVPRDKASTVGTATGQNQVQDPETTLLTSAR